LALSVTVPFVGGATGVVLTIRLSPSTSLSFGMTSELSGVSSGVVSVSSTATGASLTFVTVRLTVAVVHAGGCASNTARCGVKRHRSF